MSASLIRLTVIVVAACCFGGWATASRAATEPGGIEHALELADVVVDGEVLFKIRGATSFPPEVRAAGIVKRIQAAAADPAVTPESVRTDREGDSVAIFAGPTRIMVVTEPDAQVERLSVQTLAQVNEERIRRAITDFRSARTSDALTSSALTAVSGTLVFALVAGLLLWVARRLGRRVEQAMHHRVQTVGIQSFEILRAERMRAAISGLVKTLAVVLLLSLFLTWLVLVLRQFPWTVGVANTLVADIVAPLKSVGRAFLESIPNLVFLVVLYYVVRVGLRMVHAFFVAVERGAVALSGFEREWAMPTYKIVRLAVIAFGLIVAYPYIPGSDSAAFKGVSLFVGIVFSLGSSTAVSNIIAGYMMTYRRAFRLGDRIKVGDVVGEVTQMRLQVTHLRTPKNEEVTIPNAQIINGHVINYSTLAKKAAYCCTPPSASAMRRHGGRWRPCCWRRRGARRASLPNLLRSCCRRHWVISR